MRRKIAGLIHRFAYWLDRRADDIWDVDEIISKHLQWPDEQYPPVTCVCGKVVPEQEACWGFCPDCFDERADELT